MGRKVVSRVPLAIVPFVLGLALALGACGGDDNAVLDPTTRTFYLEAVEPKGSATVDKEAFPDAALPAGGGYALKEPDDSGKWEVETYAWSAEQIVVSQGDTVKLEILGVNGGRHEGSIQGYVDGFEVLRGKLTSLSFLADKPGVFRLVCSTHQPSMTAELVVLPR